MDWPASKQLANRQFDGLGDQIQTYFEDAFTGKTVKGKQEKDADVLCNSALRFLTQCCSMLANHEGPVHQEVVTSIKICCHGYSNLCHMRTGGLNGTTVLKTLLYIVSKLNGKTDVESMLELSAYVLDIVKCHPDPGTDVQVCDLVNKLYSVFWNTAIAFERQGKATPLQICQLRLESVRLLAQCPPSGDFLEKACLALNVFEHRSKDKEKSRKSEENSRKEKRDSNSKGKREKSKPSKNKGRESESCDKQKDEKDSEHPVVQVFSTVELLLEEVAQTGKSKAIHFVRLVIAVCDMLVNSGLFERLQRLKQALCLDNAKDCEFGESLKYLSTIVTVAECLCEEFAPPPNVLKTLSTQLQDVKQRSRKLGRDMQYYSSDVQTALETLAWFFKQIKTRKTRQEVVVSTSSVSLLLETIGEMQKFVTSVVKCDGCGGKEEEERVVKTWLDSHRCWVILFHKAVTDLPSSGLDKEVEKLIERSFEQLVDYVTAIDSTEQYLTLQRNERYCLGSVCVKLGHLMFNRSRDADSIPFYSTACQQLELWCHSAEPAQLSLHLKESSLLKLYNCLSQSLHRVGRLDDAMDVVVKATAAARGCWEEHADQLTALVKTWVKLKRSAFRDSKGEVDADEEAEKRFARSFSEDNSVMPVHTSLLMELEITLKSPRVWPVIRALLKRLLDTSETGRSRDVFQLLLLQWDHLAKMKEDSFVEESVREVDSILQSRRTDGEFPEACAEACLVKLCLQVSLKLQKDLGEDAAEEKQYPTTLEVGPHEKMLGEGERELVRTSVRYWQQALSEEEGEGRFIERCSQAERVLFRDMLMMVADLMMACREFILQLELLAIAKGISDAETWADVKFSVHACVVDSLVSLGVERIPESLLLDALSESVSAERDVDSLRLAVASLYLKTGRDMSEVVPVLNSFEDKEKQGEISTLQRGKYHRILGECLRGPKGRLSTSLAAREETALTHAQNAYRYHFSVFSRAVKENAQQSSSGSLSEDTLWRKLTELLESTLFLGQTYRYCGDHKRARCYLKEGLSLARKYGLLKWTAIFGMEVGELLLTSEFFDSMLDTLTLTFRHLSHVEPPATTTLTLNLSETNSQRRIGKSNKIAKKISSSSETPKPEELVELFHRVWDEEKEEFLREEKTSENSQSSSPWFWQRMLKYKTFPEDGRTKMAESKEEAMKMAGTVTAWCQSLASHSDNCWCPFCVDGESQRLALTLTATFIKVVHALAPSAESHIEKFFVSILRKIRSVGHGERVSAILRSAGMIGETNVIQCHNWKILLCAADLGGILAETQLCHGNIAQAVSHLRVALLAATRVPAAFLESVQTRSRLSHLQGMCMQLLMLSLPSERRSALVGSDIMDSWCWLSDAQMEIQVRQRLDLLKVKKVEPSEKTTDIVGKEASSKTVGRPGSRNSSDTSLSAKTAASACKRNKVDKDEDDGDKNKDSASVESEFISCSAGENRNNSAAKFAKPKRVSSTDSAPVSSSPSEESSCASATAATYSSTTVVSRRRKALTLQKSASKRTGRENSTSGRANSVDVEDSSEPSLFTDDAVVHKLFIGEATTKKEQLNAFAFTTPKPKLIERTASSALKKTLVYTDRFSDSEDEFKPTTPKSTPRALLSASVRCRQKARRNAPKTPALTKTPAPSKTPAPTKTPAPERTSAKTPAVDATPSSCLQSTGKFFRSCRAERNAGRSQPRSSRERGDAGSDRKIVQHLRDKFSTFDLTDDEDDDDEEEESFSTPAVKSSSTRASKSAMASSTRASKSTVAARRRAKVRNDAASKMEALQKDLAELSLAGGDLDEDGEMFGVKEGEVESRVASAKAKETRGKKGRTRHGKETSESKPPRSVQSRRKPSSRNADCVSESLNADGDEESSDLPPLEAVKDGDSDLECEAKPNKTNKRGSKAKRENASNSNSENLSSSETPVSVPTAANSKNSDGASDLELCEAKPSKANKRTGRANKRENAGNSENLSSETLISVPPASKNSKRGSKKAGEVDLKTPSDVDDTEQTEHPPAKTNSRASKRTTKKAANSCRSSLASSLDVVPEVEIARAGGDEDEEFCKDVFDFDESDDEAVVGKAKKGSKAKSAGAKKGVKKTLKKEPGKSTVSSAASKASGRSSSSRNNTVSDTPVVNSKRKTSAKTGCGDDDEEEGEIEDNKASRSSSGRNNAVSHTTAPVNSKRKISAKTGHDDEEEGEREDDNNTVSHAEAPVNSKRKTSTKTRHGDVENESENEEDDNTAQEIVSKRKNVSKQTPSNFTDLVHTDLSGIETMRMCDRTSLKIANEKCVSSHSSCRHKTDCNSECGKLATGLGVKFETENTWHKESVVEFLKNCEEAGQGDVTDDHVESLGSALKELSLDKQEEALQKAQADLSESIDHIHHFPHVNVYSESCKVLGHLKLDQAADPWEIAALLGESASVTLRHQFLAHYRKQIRLQEGDDAGSAAQQQSAGDYKDSIAELLFPWDAAKYKEAVQAIPKGWTVCQFTVVDNPGHRSLLLTRLTSQQEPFTVELSRFADQKGQEIYFGFNEVLLSNNESWKLIDKTQWWNHRAQCDAKLANVIEGMEKHWFGCWKGLLAGQTSNEQYNKAVQKAATSLSTLVPRHLGRKCTVDQAKLIIELSQHTRDLTTVLSGVLKTVVNNNDPFLQVVTSSVLDGIPKVEERDLPVVFILDKHLINLPMEQMGVCRHQPITRIPSLPLLTHLLRIHGNREGGVFVRGVEPTSAYYIVSPDGDLEHSVELLGPHFDSYEGWKGIYSVPPTKDQYREALTNYDLLVYAGHGRGSKYFSLEDLYKTRCTAVPLLFGCGSVRCDLQPTLDPDAYFTGYLLAGSPCVLGNLWEVTDKDIDTFGLHIFQQWLREKGTESKATLSLPSLVQKARSVCRMQWLNGSAPVIYGLPVSFVRPTV